MCRVQGDQAQIPGLDPVDDFSSGLLGDVQLPHMPPPDQDLTIVEVAFGQSLFGIVQPDASHHEPLFFFQVVRDLVSEEIFIGLFLLGLLLVPHDDMNWVIRCTHR